MSEYIPPVETVGELIEHLKEVDPDRPVRLAVAYGSLRIAAVLHSDDERETWTVYLVSERRGESLPGEITDRMTGLD